MVAAEISFGSCLTAATKCLCRKFNPRINIISRTPPREKMFKHFTLKRQYLVTSLNLACICLYMWWSETDAKYSATSLEYHSKGIRHDTPPGHTILTTDRPVDSLNAERQVGSNNYHF